MWYVGNFAILGLLGRWLFVGQLEVAQLPQPHVDREAVLVDSTRTRQPVDLGEKLHEVGVLGVLDHALLEPVRLDLQARGDAHGSQSDLVIGRVLGPPDPDRAAGVLVLLLDALDSRVEEECCLHDPRTRARVSHALIDPHVLERVHEEGEVRVDRLGQHGVILLAVQHVRVTLELLLHPLEVPLGEDRLDDLQRGVRVDSGRRQEAVERQVSDLVVGHSQDALAGTARGALLLERLGVALVAQEALVTHERRIAQGDRRLHEDLLAVSVAVALHAHLDGHVTLAGEVAGIRRQGRLELTELADRPTRTVLSLGSLRPALGDRHSSSLQSTSSV